MSFDWLPATYNLHFRRGDDITLPFRLRVLNDDGTYGAYIDLTGGTPKAEIRVSVDNVTVAAEFTAALADQTTTPGGVTLSLTHTQTALLETLTLPYVWDVQITAADGTVRTYLAGIVTVDADVTR